jgi:hypothetical protein
MSSHIVPVMVDGHLSYVRQNRPKVAGRAYNWLIASYEGYWRVYKVYAPVHRAPFMESCGFVQRKEFHPSRGPWGAAVCVVIPFPYHCYLMRHMISQYVSLGVLHDTVSRFAGVCLNGVLLVCCRWQW